MTPPVIRRRGVLIQGAADGAARYRDQAQQ